MTQTARKPASNLAKLIAPDYRRRYRSTPERCGCPARAYSQDWADAKGEPCKHMRLEVLRRDLAGHIRRHVARATAKGQSAKLAARDVLYSTLDYYWERLEDEAISSRFDVIAVNFLRNSIDHFERRHGLYEGEVSFIKRLDKWNSARVLGRTTMTA